MHIHSLEPGRLASFLFHGQPDEAYEIALDFLNDCLGAQDRDGAVVWTAVLAIIEKLQSDCVDEPELVRDIRAISMM